MKPFKLHLMSRVLTATVLLGLPQAFATAFPLGQVLDSGPLPIQEAYQDWSGFTYDNREFRLTTKSHYQTSKVNEIHLYFSDRNLSDRQARNIGKLAAHVALKCYNLLPERKTTIEQRVSNWLIQNDASQQVTFGPLLLDLQHTSSGEVLIWFTRTGLPSKAPWINHCTF